MPNTVIPSISTVILAPGNIDPNFRARSGIPNRETERKIRMGPVIRPLTCGEFEFFPVRILEKQRHQRCGFTDNR